VLSLVAFLATLLQGGKIMETYVTLSVLLIAGLVGMVTLLRAYFTHEKKTFHTYDYPLKNKDKWWY